MTIEQLQKQNALRQQFRNNLRMLLDEQGIAYSAKAIYQQCNAFTGSHYSQATYYRLITGQNVPSRKVIDALIEWLDCDETDLIPSGLIMRK